MNEKELLEELIKSVNTITMDMQHVKTDIQNMKTGMQDMKTDIQDLKTDMQDMKTDIQDMKEDISQIEERTLKLEIVQENITNKNIQLLMEGQQLNAEKLKAVDKKLEKLDSMEASIVALEAVTMQNTIKIKEKQIKKIP